MFNFLMKTAVLVAGVGLVFGALKFIEDSVKQSKEDEDGNADAPAEEAAPAWRSVSSEDVWVARRSTARMRQAYAP